MKVHKTHAVCLVQLGLCSLFFFFFGQDEAWLLRKIWTSISLPRASAGGLMHMWALELSVHNHYSQSHKYAITYDSNSHERF